jgi:putative colanic acid biosysnthesis UDP-glucose lipid carrier transferase
LRLFVSSQDQSIPALKTVFPSFEGFAPADRHARGWTGTKRLFDIVAALFLLVAALPLLVAIGVAIRLDSRGPALFAQRRIGRDGVPFSIFKFRTMRVLENDSEIKQATQDDPRITRVGRFLRVSSLDELPQLLNVLAGQMSVVGPRPHAAAHDEFYETRIANYRLRRLVKPGITGWAQINGHRGATPELADMEARVDLDQFYVEHQSLAFDLKILARTPLAVLSGRNAH